MAEIEVVTKTELWERQPGETAKAFAAFCAYRDMAPAVRSYRHLADGIGAKAVSNYYQLGTWSTRYNWVQRALAWDSEQDRVARAARLSEIADMNRRHAQIAVAMLAKAAARLQSIAPEDLSPAEMRAFFNDAARLERMAHGEAESITATLTPTRFIIDIGLDDDDDEHMALP
jgi:hypothetical protein